ncbi:Hypothetical Protein FCC1311_080162 [Hondaea fermentalgiana]|uniref:Uncharacterized protein n=1 Tax=Hondaea fermentalgiana TaxID=2315210 RepID=A0A2R5GTS3_9STRA|nr:Hypothetical Protein FCC1311_080162 [Hondaea fermentalgiana]|eukprot:GBG31791.1 Hypothetical Protein FCC1311_080162 [Hondaea fermentalgiana]
MVWVLPVAAGGDAQEAQAAELRDVRCLVHRRCGGEGGHGRQHVIFGAKIDAQEVQTDEIILAVPLPVSHEQKGSVRLGDAGEDEAAAAADRKLHGVLEELKLCFPQVVRESLLAKMLMEREEEQEDGDSDSNDDDEKTQMQALAEAHVCEKARENVNMLEITFRKVLSVQEASALLHSKTESDNSETLSLLLEKNEYLGKDAAILVLQARVPAQGEHWFAFQYSFDTPLAHTITVPLSTRPFAPELASQGHLEPVTRRMDHHIFSLGAQRRAGEANGAGKSPEEALHDMLLRHASGSQTVIVRPSSTGPQALAALDEDLAKAAEGADLRLRRIVGPWNTVQDLKLEAASA